MLGEGQHPVISTIARGLLHTRTLRQTADERHEVPPRGAVEAAGDATHSRTVNKLLPPYLTEAIEPYAYDPVS